MVAPLLDAATCLVSKQYSISAGLFEITKTRPPWRSFAIQSGKASPAKSFESRKRPPAKSFEG